MEQALSSDKNEKHDVLTAVVSTENVDDKSAKDDLSEKTEQPVERPDSKEKVQQIKREKKKRRNKILKQKSTVLKFMFLDGSRTEFILYVQPPTYSDLQREISRIYPQKRNIFVIQNEQGTFIDANNYLPIAVLIAREYNTLRLPSSIPYKTIFWEFRGYHANPPAWESFKEKKERITREREEEERRLEILNFSDFDKAVIANRMKETGDSTMSEFEKTGDISAASYDESSRDSSPIKSREASPLKVRDSSPLRVTFTGSTHLTK